MYSVSILLLGVSESNRKNVWVGSQELLSSLSNNLHPRGKICLRDSEEIVFQSFIHLVFGHFLPTPLLTL